MGNDRFSGMQSHQPALIITAVITKSAREDHTVTTARQFRLHDRHSCQVYMIIFLLGEGNHFLNPQSTHTPLR